jgi:hypothetical protein
MIVQQSIVPSVESVVRSMIYILVFLFMHYKKRRRSPAQRLFTFYFLLPSVGQKESL